jgi:uncharacterized membrane protein YeiH
VELVSPPLWIELTAVVAGALAGALLASSLGLDAIGIGAMAVVCGLGGGALRDVLLGTVPLALERPVYLYTVAAATFFGLFFGSLVGRLKLLLAVVDTLALGLFTTIGVSRALLFELPPISAVVLGLITGIGGGMIRDVLVGDVPPNALRRSSPYATAALAGAALYTVLEIQTELSSNLIAIGAVIVTGAIRGAGLWRGWVTPGAIDLTPREIRREGSDPDLTG